MGFSARFLQFSDFIWPFLGSHLVHATVFATIAWFITSLLKRHAARLRYTILLAASFRFAVPAVVFLLLFHRIPLGWSHLIPSSQMNAAVATLQQPVAGEAVKQQMVFSEITAAPAAMQPDKMYAAMTLVWLGGVAVLLMRWRRRHKVLARLIAQAEPRVAGREHDALMRAKELTGTTRKVTLRLTSENVEPGVWGGFRATILLPRQLSQRLTEAEMETVLVHELAHVARWDNLAANVHAFLCYIFWFHPLIWVLNRQLLLEREHACDEAVLKKSLNSRIYVSAILKTCRCSMEWSMVEMAGITGASLKGRIKRIMNQNVHGPRRAPRSAVSAIFILVAFLWFGTEVLGLRSWAAQHPQLVSFMSRDNGKAPVLQSQLIPYGTHSEVTVTTSSPFQPPVSLSHVQAVFDGFNPTKKKYVIRLQGTILNTSEKPVARLAVSIARPNVDYLFYLESGELHILSGQGAAADLGVIEGKEEIPPPFNLEVTGVQFTDGSTWGRFEPGLLAQPGNPDQMLPNGQAPANGPATGKSAGNHASAPPIGGIRGGVISPTTNMKEVSDGPPTGGIKGDYLVKPNSNLK